MKQVVTSFVKSWDQLGDVFTKELSKMGKMGTYAGEIVNGYYKGKLVII